MTFNQIINHVYTATTYNQALNNIAFNSPFNKEQLQDVKQDLMISLMNQEDKVVELFNQNKLYYFWLRCAKNALQSSSSNEYFKYINRQRKSDEFEESHHHIVNDPSPIEQDEINAEREYVLNFIITTLNNNINLSKELKRNLTLLKMNAFDGLSYRQIKAKTGVSLTSISKYVNDGKEFLRNELKSNLLIDDDNIFGLHN